MFQFIGYNFLGDGGALNNAPSNVDNITSTRVTSAIFDHLNVTRDTSVEYTGVVPSEWTYDTILDADFNGNIDAGNVDFIAEQVSAIEIKRRIRGEFNWITLHTIPINSVEDLDFSFNDMLNQYGVEYEYAIVPIIEDIEGEYIINSIFSQFNGVFIGDAENIYKLLYEVQYDNTQMNQQVGIFQVLGNKYPIYVANGELSYESGSVTATIMNDDYETTRVIDYQAIRQKRDALNRFLTDHRPKILKDWRGNIWLCVINSNINTTYKQSSGMGIPVMNFNWTQIGDANSQTDLESNGIISAAGVV